MRQPTVVFDFDGTLALGHGPVIAYARHVADTLGDRRLVDDAIDALALVDAGDAAFLDGYDAVRRLALARGAGAGELEDAYQASRAQLGTAAAPVVAPPGLGAFLAALRRDARLVLATNAPATGAAAALEQLGAAEHLVERHYAIGKPAGLAAVVGAHLARGPVLSVGDIWDYDLAPAAALGAATALVGPAATRTDLMPDLRGATLADLYDDIRSWAASAARGLTAPSLDRKA
ncbi:HAD family hydrolase [Xylanimonas protaetiae]|uniref:HAD family hydrolase n=1 Tax=Xylanimonas protaetiae TaxID=2509457 RepID=A0A4P6F663_9MICO|nr:HAD family hydrolase [Xylanimonas protaetiae]QAY71450.1 HAD family hydrolase [Xylanimonas protaetiae]